MAFDPSILTPAGQPTPIPPAALGMTEDQYQSIPVNQRPMQQWMQTPDGQSMVQRQNLDGRVSYETPRVGENAIKFQQGADGSWQPEMFNNGGWSQLGKNAYQDPKFMSFLAVAAGGALAASYAGAGTAAGSTAGSAGGVGTANMSAGQLAAMDAAGGAGAGSGLSLGAGGTAAAGAGGLGSGGTAAGSAAGSGVGGYLDQAGRFISNNPGLVGAGLGALAGAVSGNVDMTNTRSSTSEMQQGNIGKQDSRSGLTDYALPAGQAFAGMAQNTANGAYLGQGLGTNPYAGKNAFLDKAMSDVAGRMTDAYKNGTAAQSMGQFQQGGAFGGSAHQQFMEGQNRAFADSVGTAMNNMSMQDYTAQQGLAENSLNRQLSQFQGERQNMMNVGSGLANLGSNQSQTSANNAWSANRGNETSTQQGVGPWQGAVAGAIGGYGMGMQASQPQGTGYGLGSQPLSTNVQQPRNAFAYQPQQPVLR